MRSDNQLESPSELFEQIRAASLKRRLLLLMGPIVIGALVLYHVALFWDRVASQTLFEPQVGLRWVLTLALIWLAWRFRGAGVPLFRGRKALVFWLLVAFLHMCFAGPLAEEALPFGPEGTDVAFLFVLPTTLMAGLVLGQLTSRFSRRARGSKAPFVRRRMSGDVQPRFLAAAGFMPSLCRRPPPA